LAQALAWICVLLELQYIALEKRFVDKRTEKIAGRPVPANDEFALDKVGITA
jgi:hypothetical protein